MISKNNKTSDPHRLNLSDKINLKGSDKYSALSSLSFYFTWKKYKKIIQKKNKSKILAPKSNENFEFIDE